MIFHNIKVYLPLIKEQNKIFHAIKKYDEGRSVMFGTRLLSFVLYQLKFLNLIKSDIPKISDAASAKIQGSIFRLVHFLY
jgi:hypothetical protein